MNPSALRSQNLPLTTSCMKTTRFQSLIDDGVLQIGDGYRAKMEELTGTGYPFLRGEAVLERHIAVEKHERFHKSLSPKLESKLSHAGDTVVTTKGNSTGRAAYVRDDLPTFVYSPHLSFWRSLDHDKLHPGFLREWAHGPEFIDQLNGMKDSTDMAPYLSLTDQRRLEITIPSPDEQRAIARVLSALDDKIEVNRRTNRTLEELATALFRSWFVDFDPVVAKAAGRPPAHLRPDLAALFPAHFHDSELSEIPTGWEIVPVGKVMDVHDSRRIPLSGAERSKRPGKFPYYGAASVMDYIDDFIFDGVFLLLGEDGSVVDADGYPMTQYVWGKIWVNNHAHVITGRDEISTEMLLLFFNQTQMLPYVTGAVQPKLNQLNLKSVPFIRPSSEVCKAFNKVTAPWFAQIRHNQEESRTLAALRDTLLPKLLSGELRVKQAKDLKAKG